MPEAILGVYEDGMFKPLQRVDLPEHKCGAI
jgi:predicted DNA-binding antitoxin AbrB/MazE fold protein